MTSEDYVRLVFTFGREPPFPAIYPENKTPVTVDVLEVGWIVAFITGYITLILLLPAVFGKEKALYLVRITLAAFLGLVIMLCNFGHEWEVGEIESEMFYKSGSHEEIFGKVSVKLGLRAVNITLKANSSSLTGDLKGEKIDYNERFYWTWDQGRRGFGAFAGQIQRDFRDAQLRGTPYPILWVAEYFTIDGEGLRFGRHYRHAGWYAHICVWSAFVCWLLTLILFKIYIRYGAIMLSTLGSFLLSAALVWSSFRNFNELAIVFNNDDEIGVLRTKYGVHWYLALIVGIFCILAGVLTTILDAYFHDFFCKFFGLDPYAIIDEHYGDDASSFINKVNRSDEIEMMEQSLTQKPQAKRRTVIYNARGTRRFWKNSAVETTPDNAEYFETTDRPVMDPNYLHMGYNVSHMYQYPHGYLASGNEQLGYIPSDYPYASEDGTLLLQAPGMPYNDFVSYGVSGEHPSAVSNDYQMQYPQQNFQINAQDQAQGIPFQGKQGQVYNQEDFANQALNHEEPQPPPRPPKAF